MIGKSIYISFGEMVIESILGTGGQGSAYIVTSPCKKTKGVLKLFNAKTLNA